MKRIKAFIFYFGMYVINQFVNACPFWIIRRLVYILILKAKFGSRSVIQRNCHFDFKHFGKLSLGKNSVINHHCHLDFRAGITMGDNVNISPYVKIFTWQHLPNDPMFNTEKKPVIIEDSVWISSAAMILPGVKIGRGAIVAAGAVVTRDVTEFTIVAGIPAKPIGTRSREMNYKLEYILPFQ
ncbi:acyltransferase [candidate division TA06 bacterium]|nr:acyltransferase [candidate division TA06 bacterium]